MSSSAFSTSSGSDPPDIDLDFPWDERDKVLAYVFRHYPRLHSAMVANHNTFQPRGALREVAKVHGRPAGEIREVTRRIPFFYETGERLDQSDRHAIPISGDSNLATQLAGLCPGRGESGRDPPPSVGTPGRSRDHADARSPTMCRWSAAAKTLDG